MKTIKILLLALLCPIITIKAQVSLVKGITEIQTVSPELFWELTSPIDRQIVQRNSNDDAEL